MFEAKIEFDERGVRRAFEQAANEALQQQGATLQKVFDDVCAKQSGQPVDEVRVALDGALRAADFPFTYEDLDEYAQAISEGVSIKVETEDVHI